MCFCHLFHCRTSNCFLMVDTVLLCYNIYMEAQICVISKRNCDSFCTWLPRWTQGLQWKIKQSNVLIGHIVHNANSIAAYFYFAHCQRQHNFLDCWQKAFYCFDVCFTFPTNSTIDRTDEFVLSYPHHVQNTFIFLLAVQSDYFCKMALTACFS